MFVQQDGQALRAPSPSRGRRGICRATSSSSLVPRIQRVSAERTTTPAGVDTALPACSSGYAAEPLIWGYENCRLRSQQVLIYCYVCPVRAADALVLRGGPGRSQHRIRWGGEEKKENGKNKKNEGGGLFASGSEDSDSLSSDEEDVARIERLSINSINDIIIKGMYHTLRIIESVLHLEYYIHINLFLIVHLTVSYTHLRAHETSLHLV